MAKKRISRKIFLLLVIILIIQVVFAVKYNKIHAEELPKESYVNCSVLNVHENPGGMKTDVLFHSDKVKIYSNLNSWAKITYGKGEKTGYVRDIYLQENRPEVDPLYGAVVNEGVSEKMENTFILYWTKIPKYIKDYLLEYQSYTILEPNGTHTNGHAGVTCDYIINPKTLKYMKFPKSYIMATTVNKVKLAAIHEAGHMVDMILGQDYGALSPTYNGFFVSSNPDFGEVFKTESGKSGYGYWGLSNSNEYFAESFRYYFENPQRVKENTPITYAYIENLLKIVQEQMSKG